MVELVQCDEREEQIWHHPEPLEILLHRTRIYGPPGDNRLRRFKEREGDDWFLFDGITGQAVARIKPETWAKALAGI